MQSDDSERIADLERRVDYLIRYLGIDPARIEGGVMPPGFPGGRPAGFDVAPADERDGAALGPVYDAIRAGKKINAIKLYRKLTGVSLAEAKNAVDSIARGL
jgi:Ribosomal protein L7/L12 C-terminal domain